MSLQQTAVVYPQANNPKSLYSAFNASVGKTGSLTSGTLDVSTYPTKTFATYIGKLIDATGSHVLSGSFDGTNYFSITGSSAVSSGSLIYFTITDIFKSVQYTLKNLDPGVAISGSLYVLGRS